MPPQGVKLTPRHYAYLKISEGCNNRCTFCIIPALRGDLVSRPAADVLREAEKLAKAGVKELLVISQDTSAYGIDIKYQTQPVPGPRGAARNSSTCREELGEMGIWVRMHYVYPYPHVADVIPLMAEGKILPYLDIPFQHASPQVLKNMRRPAHGEKTLERIRGWREVCPDLAIRSTFIVGFPGETDEDFEMLLDWLDEAKIDRAGCFKYEPVERRALQRPRPCSRCRRRSRKRAGIASCSASRRFRPVCCRRRSASACPSSSTRPTALPAKGRTKYDAPEIDGSVHIQSRRPLRAGDIVTVKIDRADAYDLYGSAV